MQLTKSVYVEFYICVCCGLLKKLYTGESVFLLYMEEVWRYFNLFSKSQKGQKLCVMKTCIKSAAASRD